MGKRREREKPKATAHEFEEVSSIEWEPINMSEEEEDLVYRMFRLVGDRWPLIASWANTMSLHPSPHLRVDSKDLATLIRWPLIAGRIPGRRPEEIERFWIMRHGEPFTEKRYRKT